VRSSPKLEHHRREPECRDRTGNRGALVGELGQRGTHENAETLIRRPDLCSARLLFRHASILETISRRKSRR
jgi:hypothetical protein